MSEEAYFIKATKKHRFSIYLKCYNKQIFSIFDLFCDTGYKVDPLSEDDFNQTTVSYWEGRATGTHVITFMKSDSVSQIEDKLRSLR